MNSETATVLLLLLLGTIILLSRAGAIAARSIGQPPVVGEILVGLALGPALTYLATTTDGSFVRAAEPALSGLADIGLVLFMFVVGLDTGRNHLAELRLPVVSVAAASYAAPFATGFGLVEFAGITGSDNDSVAASCFSLSGRCS